MSTADSEPQATSREATPEDLAIYRAISDAYISDAQRIANDARDAARYRALRDGRCGDWAICEFCHEDGYYVGDARAAHIVDAEIDAAMGKS